MFSVLVLVLMLVSIVKVEKLQPVSVAGNPVGQCLSCKLLKIHPQFKMHPGLGAPEDNTQVFRYVYCHPQEVGSYITLAGILEDFSHFLIAIFFEFQSCMMSQKFPLKPPIFG